MFSQSRLWRIVHGPDIKKFYLAPHTVYARDETGELLYLPGDNVTDPYYMVIGTDLILKKGIQLLEKQLLE